jgi:hypothetical protein
MNKYIEESGKAAPETAKPDITEDVRQLKNSFDEYFLPSNNDNIWLRGPFIGSLETEDL